jgi:hypothetical protein
MLIFWLDAYYLPVASSKIWDLSQAKSKEFTVSSCKKAQRRTKVPAIDFVANMFKQFCYISLIDGSYVSKIDPTKP